MFFLLTIYANLDDGRARQSTVTRSWIADTSEEIEHPPIPIGLNEMTVPRTMIILSLATIFMIILSSVWLAVAAFQFQDDLEELFNETTPVIKARGMDFAMLIHETVKGIYQLISAIGIPEDEQIANLVIMNTDTLAGELEDLRYGPYIASDLHKFISNFEEYDNIDNLKEHFFGKLMALPADEFLEFIRLMLMEDRRAERIAQDMIDEISEEISEFEADGISSYGDDYDEEDFEVDDYGRGSSLQLKILILPAITLGIRPLSVIIQLCRNSLLEVLSMDYVRTATAKGLNKFTVIFKHALRNALNPVVTAVSGWFASLLAGAVFVEYIFAWNGMGQWFITSVQSNDVNSVSAVIVFSAVLVLLSGLLADITVAALDPRVRLR